MKCITCSQEIPDTSTLCPFCNNKVEPIVAPSTNNQVVPATPNDYVLPKDQQQLQNGPIVQTEVAPQEQAQPVQESVQPQAPESTNTPILGQVAPVNFDPSQMNLENIDLNSNINLPDGYVGTAAEKIGSTVSKEKDVKKAKTNRRRIVSILVLFTIVGLFMGGGLYFYFSQFQSSDKRIDAVVDSFFAVLNSVNNNSIEEGSGTYKLDYSLSKNNDTFSIKSNGKYAYNLPNKRIDLITNFESVNHNGELLNEELNAELFLENSRAYFLLTNFNGKYVYTDINNTKNVIDDVESRFENTDELLLFNIINSLYDNGLEDLSLNYEKYINNISQNDINYTRIINAIKNSLKIALKSGNVSQNFENNNNVVRIGLNSAYTNKEMARAFINSLYESTDAFADLAKIYGESPRALLDKLNEKNDAYQYTGIEGNIVITTDPFKNTFISLKLPIKVKDKVYVTTITPNGSGYKIIQSLDGNEVTNITYSKSTSSTSTTQTKTYTLKGSLYIDNVANNVDMNLELIKDIKPQAVNVVTRNSIDYKYMTTNDFNEIADKIRNFGNLGVIFNSHYVGGVNSLDETNTTPTDEEDNQVIVIDDQNQTNDVTE